MHEASPFFRAQGLSMKFGIGTGTGMPHSSMTSTEPVLTVPSARMLHTNLPSSFFWAVKSKRASPGHEPQSEAASSEEQLKEVVSEIEQEEARTMLSPGQGP